MTDELHQEIKGIVDEIITDYLPVPSSGTGYGLVYTYLDEKEYRQVLFLLSTLVDSRRQMETLTGAHLEKAKATIERLRQKINEADPPN